MQTVLDTIIDNKEWIFSGIGVVILFSFFKWTREMFGFLFKLPSFLKHMFNYSPSKKMIDDSVPETQPGKLPVENAEYAKAITNILFIDDETKFKVVNILKSSGWQNTSIVKDVRSLDEKKILEADIIFVDIQGVGKKIGFEEEGLGLAAALKEKYPIKKIVIYSGETQGNRFHAALLKADSFLPKDAEPYQFQQLVEEFSVRQV